MTASSNVRWRVLTLLVLSSFIAYVFRYTVSSAGPALSAEFSLSAQEFGWVLAAFSFAYTLFQFPAGLWVQRIGPRRSLAIALSAWAVLTAAVTLVPSGDAGSPMIALFSLLLLRFVTGIAQAPMYPLTGGVVERWFPAGSWAMPNALSSAGLTLGIAVSAPAMVWLINGYGWRFAFVAVAPLGLLGTALWWWYLRDEPHQHPDVNEHELALIKPNEQPIGDTHHSTAFEVLRNPDVLLLTLSYFCMNYVFYQVFNWGLYYLIEVREVDDVGAGFMTTFQWVGAAAGAFAGGFLCDQLCQRLGMRRGCSITAVACLLICAIALGFAATDIPIIWATAAIAIALTFHQMTEGAYWAAAIHVGGRDASAACGIMNTGGNAVGFVNALLVPWLAANYGWPVALASGAFFALAGAVLWLLMRLSSGRVPVVQSPVRKTEAL